MMFLLPVDVILNTFDVRFTHRKRTIANLPGKLSIEKILLIDPMG